MRQDDEPRAFDAWIRDQINGRRWTLDDAARHTGISRSQINAYMLGASLPGRLSIQLLARAFATPEEDIWRMLPPAEPRVSRGRGQGAISVREMTWNGSAGPGGIIEPEFWGYQPPPELQRHRFIAVAVVGDCLEPRVHPGERVIVDEDLSPRNGCIVVAEHDNLMLIKEYQRSDGQEYLISRTMPPVPFNETTRLVGVVVAITRRP